MYNLEIYKVCVCRILADIKIKKAKCILQLPQLPRHLTQQQADLLSYYTY